MYSARHTVYISCKQVYFVPFFRGVYVWHSTLMWLFPSQFLAPLVPNFLSARPKLGHHPVALLPLGALGQDLVGEARFFVLGEFNLGLHPGNAIWGFSLTTQTSGPCLLATGVSQKSWISQHGWPLLNHLGIFFKVSYHFSQDDESLCPGNLGTTLRFKIDHAHFALSPHPQLRQLRPFF